MSSDNPWVSATPLRNEDFRKLLFTPRPHASSSRQQQQQQPRAASRPKPPPKADDSKFKKPKPKPQAGQEEEDEEQEGGPGYRDRAKERREGVNLDYQEIEEELAHVLQDKGLGHDLNKISIDESKFLGGDLKHTHLVKGLDFALLQKERSRLQRQQEEEVKEKNVKDARVRKEDLNIRTPLAKSVFDTLFNPKKSDMRDLLKPRRMAFVYDFNKDADDPAFNSDIPMTLIRSKADCPQVQEAMMGNIDAHVMERIIQILSYMKFSQGGKGSKKMKKREKEELLQSLDGRQQIGTQVLMKFSTAMNQQQPGIKAEDDGGDIFDDVGTDYTPAPPEKNQSKHGAAKIPLFDNPENLTSTHTAPHVNEPEDGEVPPPPPPPPPPSAPYPGDHNAGADGYGYYGYDQYGYGEHTGYWDQQQDASGQHQAAAYDTNPLQTEGSAQDRAGRTEAENEKWKSKANVEAEKKLGFGDDAYQECFPEYHEYAAEVADSDDEDLSKMDAKGKGPSRYDFNTEEEWENHKQQREAMPKAAFQFGVKVTDGRKSHKGLEKRKDQKLDNELHKIERILKDKGHDHVVAFKKTAPHEDQALATPATFKRQRI